MFCTHMDDKGTPKYTSCTHTCWPMKYMYMYMVYLSNSILFIVGLYTRTIHPFFLVAPPWVSAFHVIKDSWRGGWLYCMRPHSLDNLPIVSHYIAL